MGTEEAAGEYSNNATKVPNAALSVVAESGSSIHQGAPVSMRL